MTPLVELRNVKKVFAAGAFGRERKLALDRLSFAIGADRPSVTAVVGESGSGKTTLARLLLGLVRPSEGEVLFQGRNLDRLAAAGRRDFRRQVQAIFQDPYEVYNPFYRVDHVLRTPLRKFHLTESAAEGREQIAAALRAVGLQPGEILGRYPHQLSGGQRQRIMVARALLLRPRLIVADEPVSMVDASLRATILGNLRELHEQHGISLLYITHDLATAYQIADSIVVLYRAAVAEAGDVERVIKTPQHPYTRLLIGSIPRVSAVRDWTTGAPAAEPASIPSGCTFADRCPTATARCLAAAPPLFRTAPNRAAACYLYDDSPTLTAGDIAPVLAPA